MLNIKNIFILIIAAFFASSLAAASFEAVPSEKNLKIQDLVISSDLVVIGEIAKVKNEFMFYGYDKNGGFAKDPYPEDDDSGFTTVDYVIDVLNILFNRGQHHKRQEVIFRTFGDFSNELFLQYDELIHGQSIFFLTLNPDGKTYGIHHSRYLINIENEYPTFINRLSREDLTFQDQNGELNGQVQSTEFVDKVVEVIRNSD